MKHLASISASEFSTTWPSRNYIDDHKKYNIKCKVVDSNIGLFKDKYLIELDGSSENIQRFLTYLKHEGFKIK